MSLEEFQVKFKAIQTVWGYDADANHTAYEERCVGDFRQFQHITDYIMRFFARGVHYEDTRVFNGVDYWTGNYALPQSVWLQYIAQFAPYFDETRALRAEAAEYLETCPDDTVKTLLTISLQWMEVIDERIAHMSVPALVDQFQRIAHATTGTGGTVETAINTITHSASRASRAPRSNVKKEYLKIVRRHRHSQGLNGLLS